MNKEQLSKRLETVSTFVRKGDMIADIGSDHAYLPVYLVKNGIVSKAIAGEVNNGPLQAAQRQVVKNGFQKEISPKLGDGLSVIKDTAVDTVIIAGMGGPLITQILNQGKSHLSPVTRLILQPNIAADHIRKWLIENGWELVNEVILKEDGHTYEILVADKGTGLRPYSQDYYDKEIWLGPFLLKEKSETFCEKWNKELILLRNILAQLQSATSSEGTLAKKREMEKKIKWLEEEL